MGDGDESGRGGWPRGRHRPGARRPDGRRVYRPGELRPANPKERQLLKEREQALGQDLHRLTAEADALHEQAARLRAELEGVRDTLYGGVTTKRFRARRPGFPGPAPIPPPRPGATRLFGAALRHAAIAVLVRRERSGHGETSLAEIHRGLHGAGWAIAGDHPVKALADAVGYDARCGRTVRTRRGHYRLGALNPRLRRRILEQWSAAHPGRTASHRTDPDTPRPVPWDEVLRWNDRRRGNAAQDRDDRDDRNDDTTDGDCRPPDP